MLELECLRQIIIGCGALAVIYGVLTIRSIVKADAGNETCPWETSAEMVQGVRYGGADVPRRVSRPFEPQLSALGGQPETVQPEMQNLYAIIKTQ